MSILDKFYLLFESDASKLDKGLEESRRKAKQTTEEIKKTDEAAYKLGESIGKAIRQLGGFVAGYLAVRTLADSFWQAVHAADKLDETADRLDVNIETLSAYGDAVKIAGGTLEGFIGSIESLNNNLAMMEVTGKSRAAPFLKQLGIDMEAAGNKGKTAMDLLPQIAGALEDMGKQEGAALARKLGLDAGTIMLLQQGRRGMEDLIRRQKELGVVSKEQGEIAAKWNDQLDDSRHALRSLWLEIATATLPVLTWMAKKFEDIAVWARENKTFLVGLMIAIGSAVAIFAVPPLIAMAVAALAAAAPFILLAAIVGAIATAFALLYDDVVNFMEGNDSLIGQIFDKYPAVREAVDNIGEGFKWLAETVLSVMAIIGQVWSLTWDTMWAVAQGVAALVSGIFTFWRDGITGLIAHFDSLRAILSGVGAVFESLGRLIGGIFDYWIQKAKAFLESVGGVVGLIRSIGGAVTSGLDSARTFLGNPRTTGRQVEGGGPLGAYGVPGQPQLGAYGVPGLAEGKSMLGAASTSPLVSQTPSSIGTRSSTTNVNVGEVNVQTQATDAEGISKSIGGALGTQMRQAATGYDDGVIA